MLTSLRLQNFKSWKDSGEIRLAPITCFFGSNSSGKTSLIQSLLLLKQTAESSDRKAVLQFGGPGSLVNLGDFMSVIHQHHLNNTLTLKIGWNANDEIELRNPLEREAAFASGRKMGFQSQISAENGQGKSLRLRVTSMKYEIGEAGFRLDRRDSKKDEYNLTADVPGSTFQLVRTQGRAWPLAGPSKCYGFPDQVRAYYQNAGFLSDLELQFEEMLQRIYYLGPLRAYPERSYSWAGGQPADMGRAGEQAIDAILSSRDRGDRISPGPRKKKVTLEAYVAKWMKDVGLISSFEVMPVSEDSQIFQVKVRKTPESPEALITDVGFGVSQILPVIVLCFYVPEGSTVILEQPEIHLHPSVQAGLADILIDAYKRRQVQVIVESHSEHFLRRLQRRIAEENLSSNDAALYFCAYESGASKMVPLDVDLFGHIGNWPRDFFGDQFGELSAAERARATRKRNVQQG